METIAIVLAGLFLAGAATAGVVVTQSSSPAGETAPTGSESSAVVTYDSGQ